MLPNQNITFRNFQGETDFGLMHEIVLESNQADQITDPLTEDDLRNWCTPSNRFDHHKDILFGLDEKGSEIGFSRMTWYTGKDGVRLYCQVSYLREESRGQGLWLQMVKKNDIRLREIAAHHPESEQGFCQAWASKNEKDWISALEINDYQAVRHFNNMIRKLDGIPDYVLPTGLDIRPVQPEHLKSIWEAQREVQVELFEFVEERWKNETYQSWADDSSHTPHLWQVAWDGDQVAGMVLPRINENDNQELNRKRGYTEHIFVRKPWRQRGLAKALLARSLQTLKIQGMEEAELGVDSENDSGAFEFYKQMGYQTESIDIWFRKPMK